MEPVISLVTGACLVEIRHQRDAREDKVQANKEVVASMDLQQKCRFGNTTLSSVHSHAATELSCKKTTQQSYSHMHRSTAYGQQEDSAGHM